MSIERFIARKILFNAPKSFSRYIVTIAVVAVALSLSVMIVATALVNGFQEEVSSKVFGFWGHIHITKYGFGRSFEDNPVSVNQPFYPSLDTMPNVRHIQVFANKSGVIKTEDQIEGIILKGVGKDFDWDFFSNYLVKGDVFNNRDSTISRSILISAQTASRLKLDVGDTLHVYFIESSREAVPSRRRSLIVSGIYNSGLEEYDKYYALVDIRHVQSLNQWTDTLVSGFEVYLDKTGEYLDGIAMQPFQIAGAEVMFPWLNYVDRIDETAEAIHYEQLPPEITAETIKQIYPNIFDWLSLQNMNEVIILVLMSLVAAINMITCLLILILERTNMVGILKALGAANASVQKIFLYKASYILGLGLLAGNAIGIGLCLAQEHFQFIRLPEASYYVSVAPVELDLLTLLLINAATFAVCMLALLIPVVIAGRITPVKAIRFD